MADKMSSELLTVIVPVYNAEKYLSLCIEHILSQTYQNLELILVNDGSTDKSGDICDSFCESDTRVMAYHVKNAGPSAARNFGLEHMHGKYLAFVDADDFPDEGMYKHLISCLKETRTEMAVCNWIWHDETESRSYPSQLCCNGIIQAADVKKTILFHDEKAGGGFPWNRVIDYEAVLKRSKATVHFKEDICTYEDKCWLMDMLNFMDSVYFSDHIGYHYFVRQGSLSRRNLNIKMLNMAKALDYMVQNVKEKGELTKEIDRRYRETFTWTLWRLCGLDIEKAVEPWKRYQRASGKSFISLKYWAKYLLIDIRILLFQCFKIKI